MKKIGVLFGMENTFPGALVERINSMEIEGIRAEFVTLGGVEMAKPCGYAVIVDSNFPRYAVLSFLFKECRAYRHTDY